MIGIEPIDSGLQKALFPANDRGSTGLQAAFDRVEGSSFGQHQDELGAKNITGRQRTGLRNAVEFQTLVCRERDFAVCRHTN